MAELESLLLRTIKMLNKYEVDYVIVGGLAAIINGSSRTTSDIDLIIAPQLKSGINSKSEEYIQILIQMLKESDLSIKIRRAYVLTY